jgi:AraC family transcriptional regulator
MFLKNQFKNHSHQFSLYSFNIMQPKITLIHPQKVIGKSLITSLLEDDSYQLWNSFMKRRKELKNKLSNDLYAIRVYEGVQYFEQFNPANKFKKFATAPVFDFNNVPEDMEAFTVEGGLYAVFHYKAAEHSIQDFYQYIFGTWLLNTRYKLDNRAHFEVLGDKYKYNDPNSEEDIWIPIAISVK